MTYKVEKDWTTKAGFRAVVIHTDSHRCGYVAVSPEHPLYGINYGDTSSAVKTPSMDEPVGKRGIIPLVCADIDNLSIEAIFDVHGGLTYSGGRDYPVPGENLWWFGFDCLHAGDGRSPEYYADARVKYPNSHFMWEDITGSIYRSLEYCEGECESLAQQLIDRVVRPLA